MTSSNQVAERVLRSAGEWRQAHGESLMKEWADSPVDHLDKWIAMGLAIFETHHTGTPTVKQLRKAIDEAANAVSCAYILRLFPEGVNGAEDVT